MFNGNHKETRLGHVSEAKQLQQHQGKDGHTRPCRCKECEQRIRSEAQDITESAQFKTAAEATSAAAIAAISQPKQQKQQQQQQLQYLSATAAPGNSNRAWTETMGW